MLGILALLAWPLVEIALFVVIGGQIGVWLVLAWVLATAVLGVAVMRGAAIRGGTAQLRGGLAARLRDPGVIGAGLFRGLAGVLLILPGFLTDALGLILLLPPVQALLTAALLRRVTIVQSGGAARSAAGDVVEGEWQEVAPEDPPSIDRPRRPSGWTQDR